MNPKQMLGVYYLSLKQIALMMRKQILGKIWVATAMLVLCMQFPDIIHAQRVGVPITGDAPITVSVAEIQKLAEGNIMRQGKRIREELSTKARKPKMPDNATMVSSFPKTGELPVIALQNTQAPHSNFTGTHSDETPNIIVTPPDCMGDVGPTQVCIASNNRLKWYPKPTVCNAPLVTQGNSSEALAGDVFDVYLEDFFASVSGGFELTDPHVHYDRLSQRWFIVAINIASSSNRIVIAVSNGPAITNQSSFSFYQFEHDQGAGIGTSDQGQFCDFPTLGVDKNALYIGGLIFDATAGTFIGSSVYVVRKSSLVAGGPIVFTPFRAEGTTTSGIFCPQGVQNDDPNATLGYFVGVSAAFFGELNYIVVSNAGGTPTINSGTLSVPSTSNPVNVQASGSTNRLDAGDDRLLNAQLIKNKNSNTQAIWTSHNIAVSSAGVALSSGADRRTATRWYAINVAGSALNLAQAGTLFDNAVSVPKSYWMGGIAASGQGHAVVGATEAGAGNFANAVIAGRYASTTAGALFAPSLATSYSSTYNLETSGTQRWGDYSQTVVDPSDDMTLWTFQEFTSATDRWAVRAIQLKAPPPARISSMTTVNCTADRTIDITVNGSVGTNFAGFFDPGNDAGGPGYASRLGVSATGNISISNITYVNPTQITFKLNYAAATLGAAETLTITNPDCQSVTFNFTLPTGCSPLPVTWQTVDAAWVNSNAVVSWKVTNEVNLKSYEVERSNDGRAFVNIGKVAPQNTAAASYQFTDATASEENYYRIRQVDKDGAFGYSNMVALYKSGIAKMSLYPNPAVGMVRLVLPEGKGLLRVLNLKGQVVKSSQVQSNLFMLETEKLARGVYIVEFTGSNGKIEQEKLILR